MRTVKTIILRTAGTNCDKETAFAFKKAGSETDLVHINELVRREKQLKDYHILAIPGGFTYGDDISSGKILANELKFKLENDIRKFTREGKLVIGICNGFQVLVKAALLPNISGTFENIESTLTLNDSNKFEDRWIHLQRPRSSKCVWTKGIDNVIELPIAHGEGKFIPIDKNILNTMKKEGLIVFEYVTGNGRPAKGYPDNPNGSTDNIAGICDQTGRVFGLMPHPERHIDNYQHPCWTRKNVKNKEKNTGDGFDIFKNGVEFAKKHL